MDGTGDARSLFSQQLPGEKTQAFHSAAFRFWITIKNVSLLLFFCIVELIALACYNVRLLLFSTTIYNVCYSKKHGCIVQVI